MDDRVDDRPPFHASGFKVYFLRAECSNDGHPLYDTVPSSVFRDGPDGKPQDRMDYSGKGIEITLRSQDSGRVFHDTADHCLIQLALLSSWCSPIVLASGRPGSIPFAKFGGAGKGWHCQTSRHGLLKSPRVSTQISRARNLQTRSPPYSDGYTKACLHLAITSSPG